MCWCKNRNIHNLFSYHLFLNFSLPCKPISLNEKILKLFKTPNEQKILFPFAGVFSEVIGGYKAGFKNFAGCEINPEYIKIGEARFEYWKDRPLDVIEKEQIISPEQQELF